MPGTRTGARARRAARVAALVLALVSALPGAAQAQGVTIEGLLSAPFPSGMVAAPGTGAVAWVMNVEGVRNVWIATAPGYDGRPLTRYLRDDGQEIGELAFSPDGRTLVFVRGQGANRQGESPNPLSDPAGVEQALWRVGTEGGDPVRIGAGTSPAISPFFGVVAYLSRGQVWWAPLPPAEGAEPVALVRVRGSAGSLRWSPDGSRLAFVSGRGGHSFVGVYDVAARTVAWMEPGVDRDGSPAWSPDGTRLAFQRIPASSRLTIFRPTREAEPWSIWVADVATGRGRQVWRAEPGAGSAYWGVEAANQLLWSADDRIVFPWERSGWLSLYSIPAAGGSATPLTPGEFEVEAVAATADRRALVVSSNQGDIDRRHLWLVPAAGGRPTPLTRGEGIEWDPAPTADGAVAYFRSDARTPGHPRIRLASGEERDLAPGAIPAAFPAARLVTPQAVHVTSADGMQVPAQLFLPRDLRPGERRPAVLFLHGGSRRQMMLGFHPRIYYHHAYALNQYLADRGYVVLSLNFRSGTGYGMEFREALDYGASGGSEFYDVLGAGLYLRNRADVDPQRIGLWGGSYGGYLTAMGLSRASDLFAAGVDIHGVHDWNVGIRTFIPGYNPLEVPEEARTAFAASPMASVDGWRSPVLLIHGDDDRNVAFAETVTLVEALRRRGVEVEQLVFPDEVHSFLLHSNWLRAYRATADFLERRLGR
jgi:dipeptidyl aminopeptidase/acylaminoacyl peptidase